MIVLYWTNLIIPVQVEALAIRVDVGCDFGAVVEGHVLECAQLLAFRIKILRLGRCDFACSLVQIQWLAAHVIGNLVDRSVEQVQCSHNNNSILKGRELSENSKMRISK